MQLVLVWLDGESSLDTDLTLQCCGILFAIMLQWAIGLVCNQDGQCLANMLVLLTDMCNVSLFTAPLTHFYTS